VLALLLGLGAAAQAAPDMPPDACLVRDDSSAALQGSTLEPRAAQDHLGWRQKTGRLFEVELSAGQGLAACSVVGTARLRGGPEGNDLILPVRPEGGGARGGAPCLVTIHLSATSATVTTTETSCRAQALCGGRIQLQGQTFEIAHRVPDAKGPCFATPGL
jgi:hypothetical protein